jgi:hypothetical protein
VWDYTAPGGAGALLYTCHMAEYSISQLRVLPDLSLHLGPSAAAAAAAAAGAFRPIHALVKVQPHPTTHNATQLYSLTPQPTTLHCRARLARLNPSRACSTCVPPT